MHLRFIRNDPGLRTGVDKTYIKSMGPKSLVSGCAAVGIFRNFFQVTVMVLDYRVPIIVNEESAIVDHAHKTDTFIPLAFVFNEFNILCTYTDSKKAG